MLFDAKKVGEVNLGDLVEHHTVVVLQLQHSLLDFVRSDDPVLTAYRHVLQSRFFGGRVVKVSLSVKPDLVENKEDVFASKPFSCRFLAFTVVSTFAHLEFDSDLLRFHGVIIAPNVQIIGINALKLLPVSR